MISGLPGEELILPGLRDLELNRFFTPEALLILIARSRLAQAGLPFLETLEPGHVAPESLLYQTLSEKNPESAYGRYTSLKKRLDSFIRCLEQRQAM